MAPPMSGEPIRKFSLPEPPPIGSGRELRSLTKAKANAAPRDQRARGERRGIERAQELLPDALNAGMNEPASEQSFFMPRKIGGFALFLLFAYAIAVVVSQGLPSVLTSVALLASAALFGCAPLLAAIERRAEGVGPVRYAVVLGGIVLPMACAGFGLALWVGEGLPWQWAIATLICINAAVHASP